MFGIMKLKNKKGEAVTTAFLIVTIIATFLFANSQLNPFKTPGQKTKQVTTTKTESKPIIVTGQDGKQYFLQATKTETSTLDTIEEPKLTLWQKLMILPKFVVLLVVLGIIFPCFGLWLVRLLFRLKYGLKQIVGGVEEAINNGMPQEEKQKVLDTLSKKYDSSTKLLVSKIKQQI